MTTGHPATPGSSSPRPRGGRLRDRHGRGARGPLVGPMIGPVIGPVIASGLPAVSPERSAARFRWPSARDRFDALVVAAVRDLEALITSRWQDRLGLVDYAVEDAPVLPDDWQGPHVPLSALIRGSGTQPTRLVIFRRPIEHRSESYADLAALVHLVLIEQLAELLGTTPEQIDARYERD